MKVKSMDQRCRRTPYGNIWTLSTYRRLGAKGSYLTLVRVADTIIQLRGDDIYAVDEPLGIFLIDLIQEQMIHW